MTRGSWIDNSGARGCGRDPGILPALRLFPSTLRRCLPPPSGPRRSGRRQGATSWRQLVFLQNEVGNVVAYFLGNYRSLVVCQWCELYASRHEIDVNNDEYATIILILLSRAA